MGADFVEEAYQEITEEERQKILADARVITALKARSDTCGVVNIGDVVVKFRLSINKKLRRKLQLYKNRIGDSQPGVFEAEDILYDIISSLCIEEPWNSYATWSVYDDEAVDTGAADILTSMLAQINSHAEDVKNFRRG